MNLTLPEKRLLLAPESSGLQLIEYALMDLLAEGSIKMQAKGRTLEQTGASFLTIHAQEPVFQHKLYAFVKEAFGLMPQLQLSRCLKVFKEHFKGDFEQFKQLTLTSLREERGLVENGFFQRFSSKIELTEKGKQYRLELLSKLKNTQANATLALASIDTDAILLGHSFLASISQETSLHTFLHNYEEFLLDLNGTVLEVAAEGVNVLDFVLSGVELCIDIASWNS